MASATKTNDFKTKGFKFQSTKKAGELTTPSKTLARSVRERGLRTAKICQTKLFD